MMNLAAPSGSRAGRILVLVAVLLMSANLRSAVASMSPIFVFIGKDMSLSVSAIAVLGMMPPLLFALCGVFTPVLVRRTSLETSTVVALAVQAVGLVVRTIAPDSSVLILGSALVFGGIGMGNVLLPPLIKRHFPNNIAAMTSVYLTLMAIGTFVPAFMAVPVAEAAGWRASSGVWAVLGLVAIVPWLVIAVQQRRAHVQARLDEGPAVEEAEPAVLGKMWRSPVAWAITIVFSVSSMNAYLMFSWLPSMLIDTAGVTAGEAGALMGIFAFMGMPTALFVPMIATRLGSVSKIIYFGVICGLLGYAGLWLLPTTLTWLWVVLLGLIPTLFPVALLLVNRRTRSHRSAVALSGFAQSVGYCLGGLGPLLVGVLHDGTGGWTTSYIVMMVLLLAAVWAARVLRVPRPVEADWEK